MPSPGNPHCISTDNVAELLRDLFPKDRFWVRMQMPLDLGLDSEPQPDVAVVAGAKGAFTAHPTTALLVVEICDTTLAIDRGRKISLYARGRIEDYWIVNLVDRCLEVYRRPVPDAAFEFGFRYADVLKRAEAEAEAPLATPQSMVRVARMLP